MIKKPATKAVHTVKPLPDTWVCLDFETTGLDPTKSAIIEIGAVRFTRGEPVAIFNTLVKQDLTMFPLSEDMIKATGHTPEDISKGMDEVTAIRVLYEFLTVIEQENDIDAVVVGQNVLFDYEFFAHALLRNGEIEPTNHLIDTLTIGRDRKPYPHRLPNLCKAYGVEQVEWHSAYFDALATGELLLAMHAEDTDYPEGKQVADYINVIGYKRQYGEPSWVPNWVTLKPQGNMNVKEGSK